MIYSLFCGDGRIYQSFIAKGFCILFSKSITLQRPKGQGSSRDKGPSRYDPVSGPVSLIALRPSVLIHRAIHCVLNLQEVLAILGILYFHVVRHHEKRSQNSDQHCTESIDLKS